MKQLGFAQGEIDCVCDVVAALLLLGNVEIDSDKSKGHSVFRDGQRVSSSDASNADDYAALVGGVASLGAISALLGVDNEAFAAALTSIQVRDTVNTLTVEKATKNRRRSSLMYAKLFDCLVQRINGAAGELDVIDASPRSISVLDIFGFEIFELNSFEQLCINFANEKLQRNFTMTTFQAEEGSTRARASSSSTSSTSTTSRCSTCSTRPAEPTGARRHPDPRRGGPPAATTDATFLAKINAAFGSEPGKKGGHPAYSTDFKKPHLFTIAHYAGKVAYNSTTNFLEKSVENVALGLVKALKTSSKPLVASFFTMQSARKSVVAGSTESSRKPSVGLKFTRQLDKLMGKIGETEAHFIRCIKPTAKVGVGLRRAAPLEQLVLGRLRGRRHPQERLPFRLPHRQFANRYSCICRGGGGEASLGDARSARRCRRWSASAPPRTSSPPPRAGSPPRRA